MYIHGSLDSSLERPAPRRRRALALLVAAATAVATFVVPAAAIAVNAEQSLVVSDDPANFTPDVLDGAVLSITQVGDTIFAAGNFTTVRNADAATSLSRPSLFAFNASTGKIVESFNPSINGDINSIDTDDTYVYVGGSFSTVNGTTQRRVAKLTTSGQLAAGQPGFPNSRVNEVVVRGDRLYVGGAFSAFGGQPRGALAAVDKNTGQLAADVDVPFTGTYNGGGTNIKRMDISPDGRTLAAVGNFVEVGGQPRQQVAMVDLPAASPATVNGWATDRFDQSRNNCAGVFDTWTRDIDFSPAGDYFVINTTGAFAGGSGSGTLCDTTTRWETAGSTAGQQPTWVNYSGGDTLYGIAVTGTAIYTGGHMRWQNNPFQGDQAGPGAVPREGIAALDPVNGLPLSWNPGRARGVGAQALFATSQGLWVGSDTERFAGERRERIAFLPLAGGTPVATIAPATLPNHVYAVQRSGQSGRVLYRINAGGPLQLSQDDGPDWAADTSSTSPLRNSGSNSATSTIASLDDQAPAGTPRDVFTTERWDPAGGEEMQWRFPIETGREVQVRLYLANTCDCTNEPGERIFDVAIDGTTVLDDLDLAATVGHKVGTMRQFDVTSDGTVNIDFRHVVENPLINAIEIIDPSVPTGPGEAPLTRRPVDANGAPTGAASVVSALPDWTAARAPFLVGDTLYYGTSAGLFARSFDEGTVGPVREVDLYDDPEDGRRIPFPTGNLTGAFYDTDLHRLYYTVVNDSRLFYRYFTPESEVVGAQTFVGDAGGVSFSSAAGLTYADGRVFFGSSTDGTLRSAPFSGGRITGAASQVSADGSWSPRGLFIAGPTPAGANEPPTAEFTQECTDLACSFNGTASSDPDGSIESYDWEFGDGATASGATPSHNYAKAGNYTVTLTVTDDRGNSDGETATVAVTATEPPANQPPTAELTQECTDLACSFNGTGSSDPDGSIESYDWTFGDGATGTGATPSHTYAKGGEYTVTLTVTDNAGATGTKSVQVTVTSSPPPAGEVGFQGSSTSTANSSTARVTLPEEVQAGDQLLMFLSTNRSTSATDPPGWTRLERATGGKDQIQAWVWSRTAGADDAGSTVSVPLNVRAKYVLTAVAYSGAEVDSTAQAVETANRAAHTTPAGVADDPGSWVLSFWTDKTSATTDWTSPEGVTDRAEVIAVGAGRVTSLLTDSSGQVLNGAVGEHTATADSSSLKALMFTVVLRPT